MILTDREIRIAIDRGLISFDPGPIPGAFSSTSIDLTLAESARVYRDEAGQGIAIDPGAPTFSFAKTSEIVTRPVTIAESGWRLAPGKLFLAWTRETIELPAQSRLAGRVEGKSSLARLGVGIHITAPTIHAGFKGQIQLEVVNHGSLDVILRPGMRICQLIFEGTLGTPEKGYAGIFAGQRAT